MAKSLRNKVEQAATRYGWLAFIGPVVSLAICYGSIILHKVGLEAATLNPHVQAVLMSFFALVAVYALAKDRKQHDQGLPIKVGVLGAALVVGTLYTFYDARILILGYVFMIVAAFLNQHAIVGNLYRTVMKLNSTLEQRVARQVSEIEGLARLKRFLSPEVAELITAEGNDSLLDSHRRFIATLFCDLRGFTAFSESMEPEEVINVLRTYHEHLGRLVAEHGGTIDHRAGDGLMVFFNDPIACEEPVLAAVRLAVEMRQVFTALNEKWTKKNYELGFGVGIASGYATLGVVGFEGRYDYTANGKAVNLAARLCDEARNGQILLSQKAYVDIEGAVAIEEIGDLQLKGVGRAVKAVNVIDLAGAQEASRANRDAL